MPYDILGRKIKLKEWITLFNQTRKESGLGLAIHCYWWNTSGSNAIIFGQPIYGSNKGLFHNFVALPIYKIAKSINGINYWFKYRFVKGHRYNVVYTDLEPGYYDIDHIMLYANFKLLERYIEHEHGGPENLERLTSELIDETTDAMSQQVTSQYEAISLYRWWKDEYPADLKHESELSKQAYSKPLETKPVEGHEGFREIVF